MTQPLHVAEFSIIDYVVFIVLLIASLAIGVYYGVRGNKTTDEFLLAGRSMSPVPVALSLIATFISSISLLGFTGEVYGQGTSLLWTLVGGTFGMLVATYVFIPVVYSLKLRSINEYLKLRFRSEWLHKGMLLLSSSSSMLYLGLCLYAPTLALESVTPYSSGTYIVILGTVVTLYSSYGGMKAVVWTDAVQTFIMVLGVLVGTISALVYAGGFGEVMRIGALYERTKLIKVGIDLHARHTVFNNIMMGAVNYGAYFSFNQSSVQRLATMPNVQKAKRLMLMNIVGLMILLSVLNFTGLCIFAIYAECDPLTLGFISRKDQIFPFFIMDKMAFLIGIPGIFVACLFSGTMSSVSSVLNAVPTMLWTDFISQLKFFQNANMWIKTMATKILCAFLGLVMICLAFMSSKLGGLTQATYTIMGIMNGPSFGVYFLGLCVPFSTKKGAAAGLITALVFMTWIGVGVQLNGIKVPYLPFSTEGCSNETLAHASSLVNSSLSSPATLFSTTPLPTTQASSDYKSGMPNISYTFISTLGASICIVTGTIVSLITGKEDLGNINPKHVLPCFRKYVGANLKVVEEKPLMDINTKVTITEDTKTEKEKETKEEEKGKKKSFFEISKVRCLS